MHCKEKRALYARGNMLLSKFGHCTVDVRKKLFMAYYSWLYCCSPWSAYDYTTLRSIHVAHNDVLRFMFHLPRYRRVSNIFVSLNIPNFSVLRRKLVYSMYKWVLAGSKSLVRILLDSNFCVTSTIFKQCMQILFSNYVCWATFFKGNYTLLFFNCVSVYMYIYSVFYRLLSANKNFQFQLW